MEATGDCVLFSVNWWPWFEQLREEAHSGRDWLADEYWIATCLRKYWIATAPRLRKGPAEQGRKFKTWGKVSWFWALARRNVQIYGKLALADEKAPALSSSVVCHIESRQSHRWVQRRQTARTTTPCSRSTCSTARGSSSPARVKYFERVVDIKHSNFPPEFFRHFNVGIFNK